MAINIIKTYPQLLELLHFDERARTKSLQAIFNRDIKENPSLTFEGKVVRPIKSEGDDTMQTLFKHLTCEEIEVVNEDGKKYKKRVFEMDRSQRLHWVRFHLEKNKKENIEIFSVEERDNRNRRNVFRTYVYDLDQQYVVVLEPQKSERDYYLLTGYYLNRKYGQKMMKKKLKQKLDEVL